MSTTFEQLKLLISKMDILVSVHGYDELANDNLTVSEIIDSAPSGTVIEDYPDYHKGPAVLLLQKDKKGLPVHAVWGIPKEQNRPAVIVTAYRPDIKLWSKDFKRRLKR